LIFECAFALSALLGHSAPFLSRPPTCHASLGRPPLNSNAVDLQTPPHRITSFFWSSIVLNSLRFLRLPWLVLAQLFLSLKILTINTQRIDSGPNPVHLQIAIAAAKNCQWIIDRVWWIWMSGHTRNNLYSTIQP